MTPNDMLTAIRASVPSAYITNTGGSCGAITVDTPNGQTVNVTPDSGPWTTPSEDDMDMGSGDWFVTLYDWSGDTWIDGAGVRDGDTLTPAESVPATVARLLA